jgi:hypothetical protein
VSEPFGDAFAERGWLAVDLPDPDPVFRARDLLLRRLRETALPALACLEDYHHLVPEEERHVAILHDLSTWYWEQGLGRAIISANLAFFRALIGPDLHIQRYPYLRAVRPGLGRDAAPLHRDTYYGASPYEVSVVTPFTAMTATQAMRVISGSHTAPDAEYPFVQHVNPDVKPQSPKHRLGFPYAPKLLDPALTSRAEAVPLEVGQVLLFGLALIHGAGTNTGATTRFSSDIRVVNSLAPVQWSRGVHADYFVPLCTSPVTGAAQRYLAANRDPVPPGGSP